MRFKNSKNSVASKANQFAERILTDLEVDRTPVDVLKVAEKLGINTVIDYASPFAVYSNFSIEGRDLYYNPNFPHYFVRFSIAREIGNFFWDKEIFDERFYNEFAGCLLAPKRWFIDDIKDGYTNGELSRMYDISVECVKVRKKTL